MGSISPSEKTGLDIIIVGAGIAGLAAATALCQKGHNVTVLERSTSLREFGASISIQANGVTCLRSWGLDELFDPFVSRLQTWRVWDGLSGKELGHLAHNKGNYATIEYGDENWNIHRKDYQDLLAQAATNDGAKLIFGAHIVKIDIDSGVVLLDDGREFTSDLVIGADGMDSFVRSQMPGLAGVKPVKIVHEQCWRCTAPKEPLRESPRLKFLLEQSEHAWGAPGRYCLGFPQIESRDYDIVLCVSRDGDIPPGRWGTVVDPEDGTKEFTDFCPVVTELLSHVKTAVKWTLGEIPPLETCKSQNGRVILIGDAWHGHLPHTASGGTSAMEDAACLGECFDWALQKYRHGVDKATAVSLAAKAFEDIRKPRVDRMREAGHEGYAYLNANDPKSVALRDQALADSSKMMDDYLALSEVERLQKPRDAADMHGHWPMPSYRQWLHRYDATEVAKEHLAQLE